MSIDEKAETYADEVVLEEGTYRGDVVTAYSCGYNDALKDIAERESRENIEMLKATARSAEADSVNAQISKSGYGFE